MPERAEPSFPAAAYARRFAICFALWLVIAGPETLLIGVLAAALATHVSVRLLPPQTTALRPLRLIRQLPGFFWASFLGGLDVIRRAFHPRMPLDPGWIVHSSRLPSSGARVALGSDLSLMPGTLSAGGSGQAIYIHCLDVGQAIDSQVDREENLIADSIGAGDG